MDTPTVSRQRLEILLASTDRIWLNADPRSLAQAIVDSGARRIPGIACSLSVLRSAEWQALEILARSEDWSCVGTTVPLQGSLSGQAIGSREAIEASTAVADEAHQDALQGAGVGVMRVVPLLPSEPLPDGRVAIGVLSFMRAGETASISTNAVSSTSSGSARALLSTDQSTSGANTRARSGCAPPRHRPRGICFPFP
jgi:hypothetical protein